MSMKKTDLEKHAAKKLDGRMKSGAAAPRFGKGSAASKPKPEQKAQGGAPRLVQVTCRLPAELVAQLRVRATGMDGGMSAVLTRAVEHWLSDGSSQA